MPQAATKLLEFKVGGTKKNKKHAIPPTHVHIVKCKGWLKMLDFFRPHALKPTFLCSFVVPWAKIKSHHQVWFVEVLLSYVILTQSTPKWKMDVSISP